MEMRKLVILKKCLFKGFSGLSKTFDSPFLMEKAGCKRPLIDETRKKTYDEPVNKICSFENGREKIHFRKKIEKTDSKISRCKKRKN